MPDELFVQHRFRDEATGYADAIVLPQSEYEALSEDDIEAIKAERVANWVEAVANPPEPVEPTEDDLRAEALAVQAEAIEARLAEVTEALGEG